MGSAKPRPGDRMRELGRIGFLRIIGRQNHGKTTLVVDLVHVLSGRGLSVGTIKHSLNKYELDAPGKDSHRHRQAGSRVSAIITDGLTAAYIPTTGGRDPYLELAPLFSDCDVVLVEGGIEMPGKKIEVWRTGVGTEPLALNHDDIMAVVTDDDLEVPVPVWPRNDIVGLAERVLRVLKEG